jgi:hypothetical protein
MAAAVLLSQSQPAPAGERQVPMNSEYGWSIVFLAFVAAYVIGLGYRIYRGDSEEFNRKTEAPMPRWFLPFLFVASNIYPVLNHGISAFSVPLGVAAVVLVYGLLLLVHFSGIVSPDARRYDD